MVRVSVLIVLWVTATAGGRGGKLRYGRRQAEEAGVTADGRRTRGGGYGRRKAEEAEVTATAGGRGAGE